MFRNSAFVLVLWAIVSIVSMIASSVMVNVLRQKETYYVSLWSYAMGRLGVFDENDPLITEIMKHNTIPFVITNERLQVKYYHLVPDAIIDHPTRLRNLIDNYSGDGNTIIIQSWDGGKHYVFYGESLVLRMLKYFPIGQMLLFVMLLLLGYNVYRVSNDSRQNRVWVGLAKETAHQLGTPISSLLGWIEYLRSQGIDPDVISEMNKDVTHLQKITDRFSKIGSQTAENKEDKKTFEMTELPSIEGSNYGRLFSIKSSLISAYKQQQTAKRRGNKALRRVLLLFAIVIVFMSSVFGSSIGKLMDVENEYNHNTFYLYTENGDTDILASVLNSSESGIDYYAVHPYYPSGDSMFTFRLASFETFSQSGYSTGLQSHGVILDESLAEGYDLLAGKSELPSEEYILISDKVADDLIETANLGFVDEYSDLIGMTCDYYSISGRRLRVGGVIRSGEHAIYLDKLAVAKGSMESSGIVRVELASDFGIKLNAGEAVLAITNDALLPELVLHKGGRNDNHQEACVIEQMVGFIYVILL